MLTVNEIFHSIQGESTYAGAPCVFVRLTACDLRCTWCDTPYAFTEGVKRTVADVVDAVVAFGCPLVEITGGEPLLQEDVYPLMAELRDRGLTVLVETGGHISVDRVPQGVVKIIDVKCPGSGESARNHWPNLGLLGPADEVKFVIRESRRLRLRPRRGQPVRASGKMFSGAVLACPRRAAAAGAGLVDPRG